jgi:hypothetical protein
MNGYIGTARELFGAEPGLADADMRAAILAAETRLDCRLPATLRDHYLTFGGHRFTRAHDRLLEPARLRIDRGMFLFYEENQAVFHWAFAIGDSDDPPVQKAVDDSLDIWDSDHDRLSQFLYTQLFHHRVRMQPCIHGTAPRGALALPLLELPGCRRELATFHRVGQVILEIDDLNEDGKVRVMAGSRDERALRSFAGTVPVDWV